MPTFSAHVSEDGSVVLPTELRERLGIVPGSEVEFFLTVDGQVHFHHVTGEFSRFDFARRRPPISIREIDDAIADMMAEQDERSKSTAKRKDISHLFGIFGPQDAPIDVEQAIMEAVWEKNKPPHPRSGR